VAKIDRQTDQKMDKDRAERREGGGIEGRKRGRGRESRRQEERKGK